MGEKVNCGCINAEWGDIAKSGDEGSTNPMVGAWKKKNKIVQFFLHSDGKNDINLCGSVPREREEKS